MCVESLGLELTAVCVTSYAIITQYRHLFSPPIYPFLVYILFWKIMAFRNFSGIQLHSLQNPANLSSCLRMNTEKNTTESGSKAF